MQSLLIKKFCCSNSIVIKRKVEKPVDQMTIENFELSAISDSEFLNDSH
ncbi:Uncharacterised protein [Mycoplasmopsis edwardii]|uniref:Uncharacterized protein n=1 Tax=Mycoplasmopsis edwardii TaxID=53558 RepID=A0A3B0PJJ1_9BACT|nr:Uncharacterised protein [Mycoplasmopsis edwardii]